MTWTNFHSHTHYCDGTHTPEVYLREAERQGLLAYGFSSHAPVPWESCKWAMKKEDLPKYLEDINAMKGTSSVQVSTSLEIDYVPFQMGASAEWVRNAGLDYSLGSVHFVDFFENGDPWEIDGPHAVFAKGLEDIFEGDIKKAIARYYELVRHMVEHDCPQIIGHLDKIKMQNSAGRYFEEEVTWYRRTVLQTLETISSSNAIVEVNTRGLYKKAADLYPSEWILSKMLELEIPIMLNSDAHHPRELTLEFGSVAELLLTVGYRQLQVFFDGEFQPFEFDRNGLKY